MNNIIDISTYNPNGNDKFFFDANIWMYLFCPIGGYKKDTVTKYDGFLKKAIQVEASIFISSLVLSEFFNDNYYKVLLSGENIKIVTDDYDFARVGEPISIVTANSKLLEEN
ncbi:MAG: hypothetical protein KJ893_05500 [Candidatus Omnitrophica bacterium]|nr:hypothetical protein [Planctomycetota bacterium]MBU4305057.1 hypothetical protein [Candidatus Omnitrophota bacterium]MBU4477750.1 hypothetical protein [Candidatus Omnitrophota bacterium]MCG2703042.1 hypothetical protein [Candidatus Omnitrophota bacterium]